MNEDLFFEHTFNEIVDVAKSCFPEGKAWPDMVGCDPDLIAEGLEDNILFHKRRLFPNLDYNTVTSDDRIYFLPPREDDDECSYISKCNSILASELSWVYLTVEADFDFYNRIKIIRSDKYRTY